MNKELLTLKNITFAYNSEPVVDDVSLTVYEGDFIGLVGQNGSGKTTLLKLMIGLLKPNSGEISHLARRFVGYVPQKSSQEGKNFPITCEELVMQGRVAKAGLFHMFSQADFTKAHDALRAVGLFEKRDRLLSELSGGQQQRIFIARALAAEPKLLILDEPTVGIDEASQEEFYILLGKLKKEKNFAIIIVSHDIEVVTREVSSILCMNKKLVYHGNPENFIEGNYTEQMYGKGKKFIHHEH